MESSALRKRATWLRSVASKIQSREVAEMLDGYADEMCDQARRMDSFKAWPEQSRLAH